MRHVRAAARVFCPKRAGSRNLARAFLVIGASNAEKDHVKYPDIDLDLPANGTKERAFVKKAAQ